MANLFTRYYINRSLLSLVLGAFSVTGILPASAIECDLNLTDVAFAIKMERLFEKFMKLEKSSRADKIFDTLLDIKQELEIYYGVQININQGLNEVEKRLKEQKINIPKKQLQAIRKELNKREKKHHKAQHLTAYETKHDDKDKEEEEEFSVPTQLVFGVTLTLCGVFLVCIPVKFCQDWGARMIQSGFLVCGNCICTYQDKKDEKNKKDKRD